jgi:GNAT superfamily N-acetyltransferase
MRAPDLTIRIEPVGNRIAAVGSLLAETFATSSTALARLPHSRRIRVLRSVLTDATRDMAQYGHVLVALDPQKDSDQVIGALLLAPSSSMSPSLGRRLRSAPANLRAVALAPRPFLLTRRATRTRLQVLPPPGNWWLMHTIAVDSSVHRRGVGTALMERGLAMVDAARADSYLHTANRKAEAMVRQFGFTVDRLIPTSYPGEPSYLLMRRPGRGPA